MISPAYSHARRFGAAACAALLASTAAFLGASGASATVPHALIEGTGSSWSANAVNQWISDVTSQGLQVVFTGSGSAPGRSDFAHNITDFAVSDIGYQGVDPINGDPDSNCVDGKCRAYAYEPIVAGGTAFPYQIKVAGKLYRNLRLSGETLAKIFTYKITDWNDPQITADNNGHKLPSLKITPVTHSEGSGSTAQFTTYLNTRYAGIWQPFLGHKSFTEYFPTPKNGQHGIQQSGSDGVMNFVSSAAANGSIGYDEYSYPLAKNWPVAKVENAKGYFVLPDQYNVAVALQHAEINMNKGSKDYLLQKLDKVYVAPEVQAYPLSSYSYFLIPIGANDTRMTTAKRQTLADYLYYSVCQGQKEMGPIGYSPLPINLAEASFAQTAKLKAADGKVDLNQRNITTCDNPTFVKGHPEINHLAKIAPIPPACDKVGAGPCGTTGATTGNNNTPGPGSNTPGSTNSNGPQINNPGGIIDPDTGQTIAPGDGGGGGYQAVDPVPAELAAYRAPNMTKVLGPLAVVELLALLVVPPVVYYALRRRKPKA